MLQEGDHSRWHTLVQHGIDADAINDEVRSLRSCVSRFALCTDLTVALMLDRQADVGLYSPMGHI